MKTREEEIQAMLDFAASTRVAHLPSAPAFMEARGGRDAVEFMHRVSVSPPADISSMPLICLLYRQPLRFEDNVLSVCVDCGERVEHRPYAPDNPKICVFCAIKREGA